MTDDKDNDKDISWEIYKADAMINKDDSETNTLGAFLVIAFLFFIVLGRCSGTH